MLGIKLGGQTDWAAARQQVTATLKALEAAIKNSAFGGRDRALVSLQAVRMNLPAEITTAQQIADVQRYVASDDVVAAAESPNGFGIKVDIKAPLLKALASISV